MNYLAFVDNRPLFWATLAIGGAFTALYYAIGPFLYLKFSKSPTRKSFAWFCVIYGICAWVAISILNAILDGEVSSGTAAFVWMSIHHTIGERKLKNTSKTQRVTHKNTQERFKEYHALHEASPVIYPDTERGISEHTQTAQPTVTSPACEVVFTYRLPSTTKTRLSKKHHYTPFVCIPVIIALCVICMYQCQNNTNLSAKLSCATIQLEEKDAQIDRLKSDLSEETMASNESNILPDGTITYSAGNGKLVPIVPATNTDSYQERIDDLRNSSTPID